MNLTSEAWRYLSKLASKCSCWRSVWCVCLNKNFSWFIIQKEGIFWCYRIITLCFEEYWFIGLWLVLVWTVMSVHIFSILPIHFFIFAVRLHADHRITRQTHVNDKRSIWIYRRTAELWQVWNNAVEQCLICLALTVSHFVSCHDHIICNEAQQ